MSAPRIGKTTLINLLMRFYDVSRGRITIDGIDIRDPDLADLRGLFSLVLQDVISFPGRLPRTSGSGMPAIDDDRLGAPRGRARGRVHRRLPDGNASPSRNGRDPVGRTETAALSFARALAFDPRVLILDEATSSSTPKPSCWFATPCTR